MQVRFTSFEGYYASSQHREATLDNGKKYPEKMSRNSQKLVEIGRTRVQSRAPKLPNRRGGGGAWRFEVGVKIDPKSRWPHFSSSPPRAPTPLVDLAPSTRGTRHEYVQSQRTLTISAHFFGTFSIIRCGLPVFRRQRTNLSLVPSPIEWKFLLAPTGGVHQTHGQRFAK